ncbi:MAG: PQQ-binding-like beta-propeller repeat protein, partial [Phycisphaerae bacterium]
RHDAARSGTTPTAVAPAVKEAWATQVGGRLSAPVVAGGTVCVADVDAHTVHALDAETGEARWQYTAGGRVDSPPTVHGGRVLFGACDGYVYCLRAADGALAWRFRAAPLDQRCMHFEQLESVWPVHGSVLIRETDGGKGAEAWCVAGRSMFLDGGMRLVRLDAATGRVLSETVLDTRAPGGEKRLQDFVSWLNMPTAMPDILSSAGGLIYMRAQPFRPDGTRLPLEKMPTSGDADKGAPPATQDPARAHLFSPTGFLDDSYWHRTYWLYGSTWVSGWCGYFRAGKAAPAGKILVFDADRVYGYGRLPKFYRWTTPLEHHLFATPKSAPVQGGEGSPDQWTRPVPLVPRGMVLAGRTLFFAGPPDLVDEQRAMGRLAEPAVQQALADQNAAMRGKKGAMLWAVSADAGRTLAEQDLAAPPVFDGLIAARGRLYMATTDGTVRCFSP